MVKHVKRAHTICTNKTNSLTTIALFEVFIILSIKPCVIRYVWFPRVIVDHRLRVKISIGEQCNGQNSLGDHNPTISENMLHGYHIYCWSFDVCGLVSLRDIYLFFLCKVYKLLYLSNKFSFLPQYQYLPWQKTVFTDNKILFSHYLESQ